MQHVPSSIPDVIVAAGGNAELARALGKEPSTVSEMKRRESIPVQYWPVVIEAASKRGNAIDYDLLVRLHATRPAKARRVAA